ncbi:MAG TPA: helix-turn-helix domain-containing protein [Mollicutes bacterium]|nr:helix-turn-helix domain-containing protein [Mollicutes bacterium]
MNIKDLRNELNMSQEELANVIGVSSRTIRRYENGQIDKYKEEYIISTLKEMLKIDEEHGVLIYDDIVRSVNDVANKYNVEYVYLFGSYAKGTARPDSDVDLLINTKEKGLSYFGLVEDLRNNLKKKVDLINVTELEDNNELLLEILKDGVKIYG